HGFRRSFVSIHLAAGYSDTWCMDRTGHETRSQLDQYRQMARTVQELELGELLPLDEAIPELSNTPRLPQKSSARVAELADAPDLGSGAARRESSSLSSCTLARGAHSGGSSMVAYASASSSGTDSLLCGCFDGVPSAVSRGDSMLGAS